jgi:hypothetical protein
MRPTRLTGSLPNQAAYSPVNLDDLTNIPIFRQDGLPTKSNVQSKFRLRSPSLSEFLLKFT